MIKYIIQKKWNKNWCDWSELDEDEFDELVSYLEALRADSPTDRWRVLEVVTVVTVLDL